MTRRERARQRVDFFPVDGEWTSRSRNALLSGPREVEARLTDRLSRSRCISLFRKSGDVYLFHDLTGDIVRMDEKLVAFLDFFAEPRTERDARERFASEFERADLDAFFAIFGEHLALVPEGRDELAALDDWYPVRGPWLLVQRSSSTGLAIGYSDRRRSEPCIERPASVAARVFELSDGSRSVAGIARELAVEPAEVRALVFRWTHSDRQVLKLLERPLATYTQGPPSYVLSTMPFERLRGDPPPQGDLASTREYHKHSIEDAHEQFEVRETTLSHAFRVPHAALRGQTYGGRIASVFRERGWLAGAGRMVEVGGGVGFFARAFLDGIAGAAPEVYGRARYVIVDLAPALKRSQVEQTRPHGERVRHVLGDAVALPLASGSVDLLIANEMIADLETQEVRRRELERGSGAGAELARRYRLPLDDAPERFWLNAGTFRFLEEVSRVLRPGGRAFVTEFGELDRYPVESTHLDHREFSIHFGHARAAAEACGLTASVESVPALLGLDGAVPVLVTNQSFFVVLRAFLRERGVALEKIAYTRPMLEELCRGKLDLSELTGLRFEPAGERVLGLRPREFKALLLTKPI
jgi:ubiquinone/menaquinone biosynthesis C-methylase UbiE